jgi:hypothetical protein
VVEPRTGENAFVAVANLGLTRDLSELGRPLASETTRQSRMKRLGISGFGVSYAGSPPSGLPRE